jgi:hypothetical protein
MPFAIGSPERSLCISFESYPLHASSVTHRSQVLRPLGWSATVSLIARSLIALDDFAALALAVMDRPFIDKTLDSGGGEVIPSTQVFTLTSK